MKRHLNTLFVMTQGTYLAKEGECILVRVDGKTVAKVPIHALDGILCFGQISYSPFVLGHCADHGVILTHLSENGRFLARMVGPKTGNVLVRQSQYRQADDPDKAAALARWFVLGKIHNTRIVLLRGGRETESDEDRQALTRAAKQLTETLKSVEKAGGLNEIRGLEGHAGRIYWQVFSRLLNPGKNSPSFKGRSRRPPLDPVNALLSFLYTVLAHDLRSALEGAGLDPYVGFLHAVRPGRPGLALDMMEEFRPVLVDRLVLSLINREQVRVSDFKTVDGGAVLMNDETRKTVLTAWQKRKQEVKTHPFLNEKSPIGLFFHTQALLLNRFFRDDLDGYPACLWK